MLFYHLVHIELDFMTIQYQSMSLMDVSVAVKGYILKGIDWFDVLLRVFFFFIIIIMVSCFFFLPQYSSWCTVPDQINPL